MQTNIGPMWANTPSTQDHQLQDIQHRLRMLEEAVLEIRNTLRVQPITPVQLVKNNANRCTKCGIQLDAIMGYVCYNTPCPTGMGSVYSSVTNQYMDLNREQA
jgi:hypothetical protein